MADTQRIVEWLGRLVQIPSVGPENAGPRAGQAGEAKIAAALAGWFKQVGAEVTVEEVKPGRPNVYGVWRNGSSRWAVVDVHTDTVGVETMQGDPFDGRSAGGRVYGRGSVDTKASLAIALAVIEAARRAGRNLNTNLVIGATIGEETGAGGAEACGTWVRARGIVPDHLLVAEPTMCAPIHGHKGGAGIEFEVQGVAAHSSQPELGQNAITAAAHLIIALDQENQRLNQLPPTGDMGHPKMSVTIAHGGQARNVIPDKCHVIVSRRLIVGEKPDQIAADLFEFAQKHCPLPVTMDYKGGIEAFHQSPDTPWIRQLAEWGGMAPTTAPYGTNMFGYAGLAKEAVVFGPGSIERAHRDVEWVDIAELEKAAMIYETWWGVQ
ncbi:MAG: M20/M25/M40 family metallo-hydrolase [Chloroflexi bacterium]|nr:M20/M25/M40 family metallo-hydrolase [Chloroflexota bacterium]